MAMTYLKTLGNHKITLTTVIQPKYRHYKIEFAALNLCHYVFTIRILCILACCDSLHLSDFGNLACKMLSGRKSGEYYVLFAFACIFLLLQYQFLATILHTAPLI